MSTSTVDLGTAKLRFDEIIAHLRSLGWENLRVDTLVHPAHDGMPRRERPTIRYHFAHGEWTISYEPDRNWHKAHPDANAEPAPWVGTAVRLVAGKELPTIDEFMDQLIGASIEAAMDRTA